MSKLTVLHAPIIRETRTRVRDRSKSRLLIAGLMPGDVIRLRLKGCRTAFELSVEQAYRYAAKLAGEKALAVKRAARRAPR